MDDPELRHERVEGADGVRLHVVRAGAGPPVILLHGFPENWRSWRHQIGSLAAAGFAVHAADLRGYNESDRPAARCAYGLPTLVEDAAALVRATGHPRAHVVGHDWGGVIAWCLAATRPELIDRLVILNAPHLGIYRRKIWRPPQLFKSWYVGFFQLPLLPERALAARDFRAIRDVFRRTPARDGAFTEADIEAYVDALRPPGALTAALNYYRANATRFLGATRQPPIPAETLVIWGERDTALSTALLEGLDRVAPRSRVLRLPDAGHWVQNEAPDEVNRALATFLRPAPVPSPAGERTRS